MDKNDSFNNFNLSKENNQFNAILKCVNLAGYADPVFKILFLLCHAGIYSYYDARCYILCHLLYQNIRHGMQVLLACNCLTIAITIGSEKDNICKIKPKLLSGIWAFSQNKNQHYIDGWSVNFIFFKHCNSLHRDVNVSFFLWTNISFFVP